MVLGNIWPKQLPMTAAVLLALLVVGCGGPDERLTPSAESSPIATPTTDPDLGLVVDLIDGAFSADQIEGAEEPTLSITAGTKVTFVNRDDVPHTATHGQNGEAADYPLFNLALSPDENGSYIFTEIGDYPVTCIRHGDMNLSIIVNEG